MLMRQNRDSEALKIFERLRSRGLLILGESADENSNLALFYADIGEV